MASAAALVASLEAGSTPSWQHVFRGHFPIVERAHYANIAYTSPLAPVVAQAVGTFFERISEARSGKPQWLEEAQSVRAQLARLFNGDARHVAFTGNTCGAINLVAQGLVWREGDNVVTNDQEHPSSLLPWLNLRARGVEVRVVRAVNRYLDIDALWANVDSRTRVVAVSWVQSTSGQRIDLDALAERCAQHRVHLVVDGIQGVGLLRLDLSRTPIDALAGGSHKGLLGPLGLGYVHLSARLLDELNPAYLGPSAVTTVHVDDDRVGFKYADRLDARRLEAGNINYPAVAGLGRALSLIEAAGIDRIERWATALNRAFDRRLRASDVVRDADAWIVTPTEGEARGDPQSDLQSDPQDRDDTRDASSIGTTTTIRVPAPDEILGRLKRANVVASVVEHQYLRFSFAAYNVIEDVERIADALIDALAQTRNAH